MWRGVVRRSYRPVLAEVSETGRAIGTGVTNSFGGDGSADTGDGRSLHVARVSLRFAVFLICFVGRPCAVGKTLKIAVRHGGCGVADVEGRVTAKE